jgi:hypothetical protein
MLSRHVHGKVTLQLCKIAADCYGQPIHCELLPQASASQTSAPASVSALGTRADRVCCCCRCLQVIRAGVELGTYMAGGYLTQSLALLTADASRAALLSTFTVLTVPVIARANGAKVKPLVWLCCVGSIIGTAHDTSPAAVCLLRTAVMSVHLVLRRVATLQQSPHARMGTTATPR